MFSQDRNSNAFHKITKTFLYVCLKTGIRKNSFLYLEKSFVYDCHQNHQSVFICEVLLFFHISYFFLYSASLFFHLLGDFYINQDHIITFFHKDLEIFYKFFFLF